MTSAATFDALEAKPLGRWWSIATDAVVEGRPVRLGRTPEGRPAVLVPATARAAGERLATRGLIAKVGALAERGVFEDWLQITCLESHLDATFAQLTDDVVAVLLKLADGVDPVSAALETVEKWRKLLASLAPQRMSEAQACGLLAELHVLEELATRRGVLSAMQAWVGHDRARVDFRFEDGGLEVKATLHRDRFRISVHGLLQMDPHEVGDLYFYGEQLERVPSGGDSVPAAADRLTELGIDRWELVEAMAGSGYRPIDEEALRSMRFKLLDTRAFLVGEGTPRITKGSFVNGAVPDFVSMVSYQLDITDIGVAHGLRESLNSVLDSLS